MKKKLIIIVSILSVLALVFAGCSKEDSATYSSEPQAIYDKASVEMEMPEDAGFGNGMAYDDMAMEEGGYDGQTTDTSSVTPEDLSEKIIYNVYATVSVDDVEFSVKAITDKVKALGGYVSYSNSYTSGGNVYANVELRVPADKLSSLEDFTDSLGEVEGREMSTQNITEDYYDIQTRLNSATKEEEQLLMILEKAETIEDILLVRDQLSRVQERIESYKGRIRLWDSLVDYSTVTYNIRPVPTLDTDTDDGPRLIKLDETWRAMQRGFKNSMIGIANFFSFLLRLLAILAIPLAICAVIAIVIVLLVKRGKKSRQEKDNK